VREAPQSSMGCTEDRGETGDLLKESKFLKQCGWYKEIQVTKQHAVMGKICQKRISTRTAKADHPAYPILSRELHHIYLRTLPRTPVMDLIRCSI